MRPPLTLTELERMLALQLPLTWRDDLRYLCTVGCGRLCRASEEGIRADLTEAGRALHARSDQEVVAGWRSCLSCGREQPVPGEHVGEADELAERRCRRIYRPPERHPQPTVLVDLRAAYRAAGAVGGTDSEFVDTLIHRLRASRFADFDTLDEILSDLRTSADGGDSLGIRRAFRQLQATAQLSGVAVLL